jgi:hypothetical protein
LYLKNFNSLITQSDIENVIKEYGLSILGEKRYNKAQDYLKPFITNIKYVEL